MPNRICDHVPHPPTVEPSGAACVECLEHGGKWRHLRMCLICGHVGCCDGSPGRHATMHYHESGHPVMRSMEPGETWIWCFIDQSLVG